jgi:hypothetical protein
MQQVEFVFFLSNLNNKYIQKRLNSELIYGSSRWRVSYAKDESDSAIIISDLAYVKRGS